MMRYKLLGRSGLRVSELCLGTMTFGEDWGWGVSKEESAKVFHAFADAGGNFVDTANYYTNGTSERFLAEFIGSDREYFVLATKYSLNGRPSDPNGGGNHRKSLVQALHASLKRLNTDYIDLYWVHAWDPMTPTDEVMRALDDVVRAGKVLYVGVSDTPAWIVSKANLLAELRGWSPFVGLQVPYSLIERTPERDLLPMANAMDLAVTAWGVLGSGVLTGKYKFGQELPSDARLSEGPWADMLVIERNLRIAETVTEIARETGQTASQVALAWVRQQRRGVMIPILGVRRLSQLEDNLGCLGLELTTEQLRRLHEISSVELGFPRDFLAQGRQYVYGDTFGLIDNHRAGRSGEPL